MARPPALRRLNGRVLVYPIDPVGEGTWVGANDSGIAMALLNHSPGRPPGVRVGRSRGAIIPALLQHDSLGPAAAALHSLDLTTFEPFRWVAAHGRTVMTGLHDGRQFTLEAFDLDVPLLFTSSSLGDALVDGPRRRLFEEVVLGSRVGWLAGQFTFHRHRWSARPEVSVWMARRDATTVSRTQLDVTSHGFRVEYEPLGTAVHGTV